MKSIRSGCSSQWGAVAVEPLPGVAVVRPHVAKADFAKAEGSAHQLSCCGQDQRMADDSIQFGCGYQGVVVAGLVAALLPAQRRPRPIGVEQGVELGDFGSGQKIFEDDEAVAAEKTRGRIR